MTQTMTAADLAETLAQGGAFRVETPQYRGVAYGARVIADEADASRVRYSLGLRTTPAVGDVVLSDGVRASVWEPARVLAVTAL